MYAREGRVTTITYFEIILIIRKISAIHFILKLLKRSSFQFTFKHGLYGLSKKAGFIELLLNSTL